MAFPGTYNINYYRGDLYEFRVYPKDTNGDVFNLEGFSSKFTIATSTGSSPVWVDEATAQIDPSYEFIKCSILPLFGRTNLNPGTTYYYDVQVSGGTDVVYTLLKGTITVTADVSTED